LRLDSVNRMGFVEQQAMVGIDIATDVIALHQLRVSDPIRRVIVSDGIRPRNDSDSTGLLGRATSREKEKREERNWSVHGS